MKTPEECHNQGQEDRAEGKEYTPPHSVWNKIITFTDEDDQKKIDNNNAYREGWKNHKDQTED